MTQSHIAIQLDALDRLNAETDTTILLMRAAHQRGHRLFLYQPAALRWHNDGVTSDVQAAGCAVLEWPESAPLPKLAAPSLLSLDQTDIVLMRQEPPFDMAYITATYLLELLPPHILVVNAPRAVRDAPEKLFITRYPDLLPPTLISNETAAIMDFRAQHGSLVLKPLYGYSAHGIGLLHADDTPKQLDNFCQQQNGLPFIVQKFLPEVAAGDKRIILLNGQIIGALNRVPQPGNFLANLRVGGKPEATSVTTAEAAMVQRFAADLTAMGIILAGIDVIGNYVTEINVTCPGGLLKINQANNLSGAERLEEQFWECVEARSRQAGEASV